MGCDLEQVGSSGLVGDTIGAISRRIREKDLMPGDRLPSEAILSKELNVSRTVVREAFRSLAAMRIIELATGKRATGSRRICRAHGGTPICASAAACRGPS